VLREEGEEVEEDDLVAGVVDIDLAPRTDLPLTDPAPTDQVLHTVQADLTALPQVAPTVDPILHLLPHHHRVDHLLQEALRPPIIHHTVLGLFPKPENTQS